MLPLAATEQHGPHLPLDTDVMIAEAYLARVRELLPATLPVTFLPVEPVGISTEHTDFPGTQTLSDRSALKRWMAIGESVARARHQQARDGHEPRRQQRRDDARRAGLARASQHARGHHRWSRFGAPDGLVLRR